MQQLGGLLVEGLKATPGCLGVDLANARSGKNIIFAWFENKAAALAWYRNPVHVGAMTSFGMTPDADHKPMATVPDDVPIMAVASLSFPKSVEGDTPNGPPAPRFSIELYSPLTGGIATHEGANFSPPEFLKRVGK